MSNKYLVMTAIAALTIVACDSPEQTSSPEVVEPTSGAIEAPSKRAGADDRYATKSPATNAVAGASTELKFRIEPRGDLKINKEYPWSIEFADAAGVKFEQKSVGKADIGLSDEAATIPVKLTAGSAGKTTIAATGNFSVCNPQRCDILRDEPLEFTVVAVDEVAEVDEVAQPADEDAADSDDAPQ